MCSRLGAWSVSTFYYLKHNMVLFLNYSKIDYEINADITVAAKRRKRWRKRRYFKCIDNIFFIFFYFAFLFFLYVNFCFFQKFFKVNQKSNKLLYKLKQNKNFYFIVQNFFICIKKSWKFSFLLILISIFCLTIEATPDIIVPTKKFERSKIYSEKKQNHQIQQYSHRIKLNQKQQLIAFKPKQQKQKLATTESLNNYHLFIYQFKNNQTLLYTNPINLNTKETAAHTVIRRHIKYKYEVSPEHPIHILFPLPTESGRKEVNPFGITIDLSKPVVDEAIDEVYRRQLVPLNSLSIHFEDSRLSDAHGPNVAINQLVDNRLDCIIGKQ